jgi:hypothetical protein
MTQTLYAHMNKRNKNLTTTTKKKKTEKRSLCLGLTSRPQLLKAPHHLPTPPVPNIQAFKGANDI